MLCNWGFLFMTDTDFQPYLKETLVKTDLVSQMNSLARKVQNVQSVFKQEAFRPDVNKHLRRFSTKEAADLIPTSSSYLLKLSKENPSLTPEIEVVGSRYFYSLNDINKIREHLYTTTNKSQYRRKRPEGSDICVVSPHVFKGGASKTTTCLHLGHYLAMQGYRILMIDLDGQASLTTMFGYDSVEDFKGSDPDDPRMGTVFTALNRSILEWEEGNGQKSLSTDFSDVIQKTYFPGIDLVGCNLTVADIDFQVPLAQMKSRTHGAFDLHKLISSGIDSVKDDYDIVIIDSPPAMNYISMAALYSADISIVPVRASILDFSSVGLYFDLLCQILETFNSSRSINKNLFALKVLPAVVKPQDQNQMLIVDIMKDNFGNHMMDNFTVESTMLAFTGLSFQSLYEISKPDNRQTYQRALTPFNAVNKEIEGIIQNFWGTKSLLVEKA